MPLNRKGVFLKGLIDAHGIDPTCQILREAMELPPENPDRLKPEDFSLRELAESLVGPDWVRSLDPAASAGALHIPESVDSSAFANITGQIIFSKIMEGWQTPALATDQLVTTVPTSFLDGEKIPGMTTIQGDGVAVNEGQNYPELGFGEDYIETPATVKTGLIVAITKEAVYKDRTGLILQRAGAVGERLAMTKAKKVWDLVLGITNNFKWRGTSYNTFNTAGSWINKITGNSLVDWTNIDAAEQLFWNMVSPDQTDNGSEPITFSPDTMIVMPAYDQSARQTINAVQIETINAANTQRRFGANSYAGKYKLLDTSQCALAYQRLLQSGVVAANAKPYWLLGNPKRAFNYMEVWPITVVQAPPNNTDEFNRDIVAKYKASERGVPAVNEPRGMVLSTG